MVPVQIENLFFKYPSRQSYTLNGINAKISAGDFVLLTGQTGCGKTTLLRTMNGLIPHSTAGSVSGSVKIDGQNVSDQSLSSTCQQVAFLFQNPDTQLFCTHVKDEIAFGLENVGVPPDIIKDRITLALEQVGLSGFENTLITELSGGEKQRVALASVISMQPQILLLDEPTSHLDPCASHHILNIVKQMNTEEGITVVIATHRVKKVEPLCNRVWLLNDGQLCIDLPRKEAFQDTEPLKCLGVEISESDSIPRNLNNNLTTRTKSERQLLTLREIHYRYPNSKKEAVKEITCDVFGGEIIAIMGANGSGKTTLLRLMGGLLRSTDGHVIIDGKDTRKLKLKHLAGKVGFVFQNPDLLLQAETVKNEIAFGPKNLKLKPENINGTVDEIMSMFMLSDVSHEAPHSLSRGQRQRVAVAATFSLHPNVFLLDEPTTGQDAQHLHQFMDELCNEIRNADSTLIFATHNIELTQKHADRVILLCDGVMIFDGKTDLAFSDSNLLEKASLRF